VRVSHEIGYLNGGNVFKIEAGSLVRE
jgi:hypothetical protein